MYQFFSTACKREVGAFPAFENDLLSLHVGIVGNGYGDFGFFVGFQDALDFVAALTDVDTRERAVEDDGGW